MVVNSSNLYSESFRVIKSHLNNTVTDPKVGSSNSRRRWIYRNTPDTTSRDFSGYPLIVINQADNDDDLLTLSNTFSENVMTFDIDVYAEFNDENGRLDTVCDGIYNAFKSKSGLAVLEAENLFSPQITTASAKISVDRKDVVQRTFTVTLNNNLCGE